MFDTYQLHQIAKYFPTIQDFINLEIATNNTSIMTSFSYNPISLSEQTIKYFPNIKTLHYYSAEDVHFPEEQYEKIVHHYMVNFEEFFTSNLQLHEYKQVELSGDYGNSFHEIPPEITRVGRGCFEGMLFGDECFDLYEIIIPEKVTSIGDGCFNRYSSLSKIELSTRLKSIGSHCFNDLNKLIGNRFCNQREHFCSFELPWNITSVNGMLVNIDHHDSFCIPSYVTKIDEYEFYLSNYTKITLSQSLTILPKSCFRSCKRLKSITIPTTVTRLENACFYGCDTIASLTIPSSVKIIENECMRNMRGVTRIELCEGVEEIGRDCFRDCKQLVQIVIPSSVKVFGKGCFCGTGLKREEYSFIPDDCF